MAEKSFVYETLLLFLDSYFICGDRETVLQMSTEDIYCIGVQGEAPAFNREEFDRLLRRHIAESSSAAVYEVNGYREKKISPGNWVCYSEIETYMDIDGEKLNLSWWGMTLGIQQVREEYKISLIHLSEMKNWAKRGEALRKLYPDGENPFIESLYRHLEESSRDSLTGLYNRQTGENLICQALDNGGEYIFLLMDIDNFKAVNDVYGHLKGDIMLKYVADKIRKSFRDTDVIFRLGEMNLWSLSIPVKTVRLLRKNWKRSWKTMIEIFRRSSPIFPLPCPGAGSSVKRKGPLRNFIREQTRSCIR